MQLLAWISKIHQALHECAESIRYADRRKKEHCLPPDKPVETRAVISFDKDTVAKMEADSGRNHATQESIKKATWAGFAAVSVYALITLLMWRQMIRQAEISQKQIVISQRPWLGIYKPTIKQTPNRWFIDFQLKNFGNSPSLHSTAGTNPVYPPFEAADMSKLIESACKSADEMSAAPVEAERHGYTVFPAESDRYDPGQTIERGRQSSVYFIGCLAYLDQFTAAARGPLHHTRFCYYAEIPLTEGEELSPCFGGQQAD
jgi:hypothetical protein